MFKKTELLAHTFKESKRKEQMTLISYFKEEASKLGEDSHMFIYGLKNVSKKEAVSLISKDNVHSVTPDSCRGMVEDGNRILEKHCALYIVLDTMYNAPEILSYVDHLFLFKELNFILLEDGKSKKVNRIYSFKMDNIIS